MKKLFYNFTNIALMIAIVLCFSNSCNRPTGDTYLVKIGEAKDNNDNLTFKLERFAYDFYRNHENLNKNSILREEAKKEFQAAFKEKVNKDSLLNGVPVVLKSMKDLHDGYCITHFWCDIDRLNTPFNRINFDLAVKIPKDKAITLIEGYPYNLKVKYIKHIDNVNDFQKLVGHDHWLRTDNFELTKVENSSEDNPRYNINLGMMLVELVRIIGE